MGRHLSEDERAYVRAVYDLRNGKLGPTALRKMFFKRFKRCVSKATVWSCMHGKTHNKKKKKKKVGRKRKTSTAEDGQLIKMLKPLQKKWHKKRGAVTARVLKAHWTVQRPVSRRTISRRLTEAGKPWRPVVRKLALSQEDKAEALIFARKYMKKPYSFFENNVLYIDNKNWPLYTTMDAKEYSVSQGVKGMYRDAKDGLEFALPSKAKHRKGCGYRSLNILGGFGNGKCHFAYVCCKDKVNAETGDAVKTTWSAAEYKKAVRYGVAKAFREDPSLTHLWRDGDPTGFDTLVGRDAEAKLGRVVIQQPHRRPGLNPLDYSLHSAIEDEVKADTVAKFGDGDSSETPQSYRSRVRSAYFQFTEGKIRRTCRDLKKRRLRGVVAAKGGHFSAKYGSD